MIQVMDEQLVNDALRYQRLRQYALAYYHRNAEAISARRKEKYRAAHPDAVPRPNAKPKGVKAARTDLNNAVVE
jgi:hypothetical protein